MTEKQTTSETLEFKFNRKSYINGLYFIQKKLNNIKYCNSFDEEKKVDLLLYKNRDKIETFLNETISQHCLFEIDLITRLYGFFKALEDGLSKRGLNSKYFELYIDGKISIPFLMKKVYNSPSYYLALNCINKKELETFSKSPFLNEEQKESINSLSCMKKRSINTPQTSFLVGYLYGKKFLNGEINIEDVFHILKKEYNCVYRKHNTISILNKCELE